MASGAQNVEDLTKISSVMVRFMWNGVDHLGIGSKLLTEQEQKTLVDGGMWRLHKGPVIGEASHSKSRTVSVCDRTFASVSSANRCLVVRVDIRPTRTQRNSSTEVFPQGASDLKKVKAPVSHGRAGGKLLEYCFEALGLLSADQSSTRWLATHGKELKMVQKDVLRGWHGTCHVEGNWNELDQNEASRRNARRFRSYFRHDSVVPGGDSSKLVSYSP